jgi:hypothetical protein
LPASRLLFAELRTLLDHLLIAELALPLVKLALLRSQRWGLLLVDEPLTLDRTSLSEIALIQRAALIEPALPNAASRPWDLTRAW